MTTTKASVPPDMPFQQGIGFLTGQGLNLISVLDCHALPAAISTAMRQAQVPLTRYRRLILLGHAGKTFWRALNEFGFIGNDPVDYYSRTMTERFVHDYLGVTDYLLLYPGDNYLIPLQQLGALAGWHHPSPLGIGIHPRYGLWFAYRTAFLIDQELPLTRPQEGTSPCDSCAAKPCISACPAAAVQYPQAFDVNACIDWRLARNSSCSMQCLARLACPVAAEHRYSHPQIQYHSSRSLGSIRAWRQQQS